LQIVQVVFLFALSIISRLIVFEQDALLIQAADF